MRRPSQLSAFSSRAFAFPPGLEALGQNRRDAQRFSGLVIHRSHRWFHPTAVGGTADLRPAARAVKTSPGQQGPLLISKSEGVQGWRPWLALSWVWPSPGQPVAETTLTKPRLKARFAPEWPLAACSITPEPKANSQKLTAKICFPRREFDGRLEFDGLSS
jgi:hypothetical protein